jgi:hypothetical protein
MRGLIGLAAVVFAIVGVVAAVGIVGGGAGAAGGDRPSAADVAVMRRHYSYCAACRASGKSIEWAARPDRAAPCVLIRRQD